MNIELFFSKVTEKLQLGNIIEKPTQVTGGLTHRMFKLFTDKGKYIVKLLNPNIMKRSTAIANFTRADSLEEILKEHNIEAIYSLKFNNKKMQEIDGQFFYVYEWFDGKSLKDNEITKYHCKEIGKVLADIHNIDLKEDYKDDTGFDPSKKGFVVTATYGGAESAKPGSWGLTAKYYNQGIGTFMAHTMDGLANDFIDEGFKGWSLAGDVTVAKNMIATVEYFDLKGKESDTKAKTIWSQLAVTF